MSLTKIKNTKKAKDEAKMQLIIEQGGRCPITGRPLRLHTSVLDHDHDTGRIRAALPTGVNGMEGKIYKNLVTWGKIKTKREAIKTLRNLADFWENSLDNPKDLIYPTHKTPEEKREAAKKKARKAYAAKRKALNK
jgi:hypothetical protein